MIVFTDLKVSQYGRSPKCAQDDPIRRPMCGNRSAGYCTRSNHRRKLQRPTLSLSCSAHLPLSGSGSSDSPRRTYCRMRCHRSGTHRRRQCSEVSIEFGCLLGCLDSLAFVPHSSPPRGFGPGYPIDSSHPTEIHQSGNPYNREHSTPGGLGMPRRPLSPQLTRSRLLCRHPVRFRR